MIKRVYWPGEIKKELCNSLRDKIIGVELLTDDSNLDVHDYQVLISGVPDEGLIKNNPNLETLIIPWAGLPKSTGRLMQNYPNISVHNIHHNAGPAAETAIALLCASARKIVSIDRNLRKNDWTDRYQESGIILLEGKTAVILGYGAIGQKIDFICSGLGIKTIAVTRTGRKYNKKTTVSISEFQRVLPQADILFIALPWTNETDQLIGASELGLLPDNAILINIARGALIDESALYDKLKAGRIRAGLDVWYNYPKDKKDRKFTPPANFPFNELDNVVLSPHMGGHSDRTDELRIEHLAKLLNLAAQGQEMPNRVDLDIGY